MKTIIILLGLLPIFSQAQNDTVANFDATLFNFELDTIVANLFNSSVEISFEVDGIDLEEFLENSQYTWSQFILQASLREYVLDSWVDNFSYESIVEQVGDSSWTSNTTFVLTPGVTNLEINIGLGYVAHVFDSLGFIIDTDVTEYWIPDTFELDLGQLITSTSNVDEEKLISCVFPNPANDYVTIASETETAEICNSIGQLIKRVPTNKLTYIGDLPKGLYYVDHSHKLFVQY